MKKGDVIYCIDECIYSNFITKRNSYIIEGIDKKIMRFGLKVIIRQSFHYLNTASRLKKSPKLLKSILMMKLKIQKKTVLK